MLDEPGKGIGHGDRLDGKSTFRPRGAASQRLHDRLDRLDVLEHQRLARLARDVVDGVEGLGEIQRAHGPAL